MKATAHGIAIGALAYITLLSSALADEGCGKFAWSLAREQVLLAAADKAAVQSGDTLATLPPAAFTLHLKASEEASFSMPPERRPRTRHWFGGNVRFPAPDKPGIYQVTLSDEAWIDVVQDGRYARSVGSTGRSDCPGVRKSVRLELAAAPFVLQVSGAAADKVAVAISAVQ